MTSKQLFEQIQKKQSLLCIGLDSDLKRIPAHLHLRENPILEFNKRIIDATHDLAIAYKPNLAFYEMHGPKGWKAFKKTLKSIPDEILTIADAKRGDIGNTARMYASTFYDRYNVDSVTVAPYMGSDSVTPFLEYPDKWTFLLALTSNPGAQDFQWHHNGKTTLYQQVVSTAEEWAKQYKDHQLGYVVGATRPEYLHEIRQLAPKAFFLVPGIGAQGGDLEAVLQNGLNDLGGMLINSSRGILYASDGKDFAQAARKAAQKLRDQMAEYLDKSDLMNAEAFIRG